MFLRSAWQAVARYWEAHYWPTTVLLVAELGIMFGYLYYHA